VREGVPVRFSSALSYDDRAVRGVQRPFRDVRLEEDVFERGGRVWQDALQQVPQLRVHDGWRGPT